jgi:phosphoribosylformylglycinamidine cyclo-ligase
VGDVLLGIASSGVHSNGFSLVRKIVADKGLDLNAPVEGLGAAATSLGEVLLTPTKIYVKPVLEVLAACDVHGISHITGGGFYENIPRMLSAGQGVAVEAAAIDVLPIFSFLETMGGVPRREMFNVFNMGIGMVIALPARNADAAIKILQEHGEKARVMGEVIKGEGVEILG